MSAVFFILVGFLFEVVIAIVNKVFSGKLAGVWVADFIIGALIPWGVYLFPIVS